MAHSDKKKKTPNRRGELVELIFRMSQKYTNGALRRDQSTHQDTTKNQRVYAGAMMKTNRAVKDSHPRMQARTHASRTRQKKAYLRRQTPSRKEMSCSDLLSSLRLRACIPFRRKKKNTTTTEQRRATAIMNVTGQ